MNLHLTDFEIGLIVLALEDLRDSSKNEAYGRTVDGVIERINSQVWDTAEATDEIDFVSNS